MPFRLDSSYMGYPPIEVAVAAPASGSFPPISPGIIVDGEDPVWGGAEFVFGEANGSIRNRGLCVVVPVFDTTNLNYDWQFAECPNTANLGQAVYVCMAAGGLSSGQFGWFMKSGLTPINGTASVAANTALGITAAGQVGANTAGKQINGGRVAVAATQTVAKAGCSGISGDTLINVPNTSGLFVGGFVAGTGVGAAAAITFIDPLGKYILVSVANSATFTSSTVTQTANNATIFYNIVQLNNAFAQGAIT